MGRPWSVFAVAVLLSAGCQSPTELLIAYDFDPELRAHATRIEATVYRWNADEPEFVLTHTVDIDDDVEWPHYMLRAVPVAPSSSEVLVVAEATLVDGDRTWSLDQSVRAEYTPGESRQVVVRFDACETSCPDPLRCWEGQCIERCVETQPTDDGTAPSPPIACSGPCADACVDGLLLGCNDDGVGVLREDCWAGCSEADQCDVVWASNVETAIGPGTLGELRAATGVWMTLRGSELRVLSMRTGVEETFAASSLAGPITVFGQTVLTEPGADYRIERVMIGGVEHEYLVVEVGDLVVEEGAVLSLDYQRPVILLVHGTARIDGSIEGRGGRGSPRPAIDDRGDGATSGERTGGGAGGGFATPGGAGGWGGSASGGRAADELDDEPTLVPLIGGANGGRGGGSNNFARGGGAVQITAGRWICLGPGATLRFEGHAGADANGEAGAGGGGSGGGVLLEAPVLYVERTNSPAIDARGGNGGRGREQPDRLVARSRGEGDDDDSGGGDGKDLPLSGGGGGGGAGRVRLNTLSGTVETTSCPARPGAARPDGEVVVVSSPPASHGVLEPCHPSTCGGEP